MSRVEKSCECRYQVFDDGLVREFKSMEDAEKFREGWDEFKKEVDRIVRKLFDEWDDGWKINIEWSKTE